MKGKRRPLSGHGIPLLILLAAFLVTTVPFLTDAPFTWDGGQLVLGVHHFSVRMHQPHAPGYPLFIALGKLLSYCVSAHRSLQVVSAGFAAAAVLCLYLLAWQLWKDRGLALLLALAFLVNPLFWLYRETCLTYTVDAFAATMTAFLGWLGLRRRPVYFYWNSLLLGLVGGFRPSLVFLLTPLLLLPVALSRSWKRMAVTALILIASCLLWYVPLVALTGGLESYRELSRDLFKQAASSTSYLFGAPLESNWLVFKRLLHALLGGLNLILIPTLASLVWSLKKPAIRRDGFPLLMSAAWVFPPVIFYSLIHYGPLGYTLILLPAAYVLLGPLLSELSSSGALKRAVTVLSMILLMALQTLIFVALTPRLLDPGVDAKGRVDRILQPLAKAAPTLFSINAAVLRDHDRRVRRYIEVARSSGSGRTIVMAGENSLGALYRREWREPADNLFRSLGAELPDFQIFYVPAATPTRYALSIRQWRTDLWGDTVAISENVRRVVFAIDSIPSQCQVEGLRMETRSVDGAECQVGEIEGPEFRYCGVLFRLERP